MTSASGRSSSNARRPVAPAPGDALSLLHELQVHQTELEAQNAQLREAQAELEASREKYFDLYDRAPVGYCTLSAEGLILEANLTAAKLLGVERAALLREPLARFILPPDSDIFHRHQRQLRETRAPLGCDLRLNRPDHRPCCVHLEASLVDGGEAAAPVCRVTLTDITARLQAEVELRERARHLAAINELATANVALAALLAEAVALIARTLDVEFCQVLELLPDGSGLKLVAGVGWREGLVGHAVVDAGLDSQAGCTLVQDTPVIVADLRTETRFRGPALLSEHGIVSGLSARIGLAGQPWGVLGAHSRRPRSFSADEIGFLQTAAFVLGMAIARAESERTKLELTGRVLGAEEIERRRIAKELHDSTAQNLVAAILNLATLRDNAAARDPAEAAQLEDSIALLENSAHEIRTLSYLLHPPQLDEAGLPGAILHYLAGFGDRTGMVTRAELPAEGLRLEQTVELALFRVVQEALGNIYRHAQSPSATVRLARGGGHIVLEIRDEGRGIPRQVLTPAARQPDGLGVGLPAMRERLRQIGGRLEIVSSPAGTTVRAVLPVARGGA